MKQDYGTMSTVTKTKLEEFCFRYRFVIIIALFLTSLIIHAFFTLDGLGEQDTARLVIDAAKWHISGKLIHDVRHYPARISPLYLIFLKGLIEHGIALRELPAYMNWINWFLGAFVPIVVFAVSSQWMGYWAALVGTIFLSVNPAFWTANIYGFPSLPALLFFWTSLLLFHQVLKQEKKILYVRYSLGCLLFSFLCLGLKLDLILAYPALLGILVFQNRSWRFWNYPKADLAMSILIPALAVFGVIGLTNYISTSAYSTVGFTEGWSGRFPWTFSMVTKKIFFMVPGTTFGPVMTILVIVAILHCLLNRQRRWLLFLILSFSLPITLFWAFRLGDSARHWLLPASGLIFLPAVWLTDRVKSLKRFLPIGFLIIMANYFLLPPSASTVTPSSRLIASNRLIQEEISSLHKEGQAIFKVDAPKICVVASWQKPYVIYELLAGARNFCWVKADAPLPETHDGFIWKVTGPDGKVFYVDEYSSEPQDFIVPQHSDWVYWNPKIGRL